MVPMPTARPQHASFTTSRPRTRPAQPLAPFRPGALWRLASGQTFRVSKDATRIHFAADHNKRNVVHLSSAASTPSRLPDEFLRSLLLQFSDKPAWASAHRNWRAHQDEQGRWSLTLELRGGDRGRLQFPPPADMGTGHPCGVEFDTYDLSAFERIVALLWERADEYEKDPHAPADLSLFRPTVSPLANVL